MYEDIRIPAELLRAVCAWFSRVANESRTNGGFTDSDRMLTVLTDVIGLDPTFSVLRSLDGSQLVDQLREDGTKVPKNTRAVFEGFASQWIPTTPRCPNDDCGLPAIYPLANKTGATVLAEGVVCPWCQGSNVRSFPFEPARSWVTWAPISVDDEYDRTSVPGVELPLREGELRRLTHPGLLAILDEERLLVRDWLHFLLNDPNNPFGIKTIPIPVLRSLGDGPITFNLNIARARVLLAKRALAGAAVAASVAPQPVASLAPAPTSATPSRAELLDLLTRMNPIRFERMLFDLSSQFRTIFSDVPPRDVAHGRRALDVLQYLLRLQTPEQIHAAYLAAQNS